MLVLSNVAPVVLSNVAPVTAPTRSSVDEVIGLLSAPTADGGFEDEGKGTSPHQFDPAQFDSWRNSLTKVIDSCELSTPRTDGMIYR